MSSFQNPYSQDEVQAALFEAHKTATPFCKQGELASYIPALLKANPRSLGIALCDTRGKTMSVGEAETGFTIQSISKVFTLAYVIDKAGEDAVFSRVGKEPSGDPFNSIIRLETSERRKPYNPFINAGAIALCELMPGGTPIEKIQGFHEFLCRFSGSRKIDLDEEAYKSEKETAARNRSIAWFLKELGIIKGNVDECLDTYFLQCATVMNASQLARAGLVLAMDGWDPVSSEQIIPKSSAHIVKSLMATCGMYDGSGEFAVLVGIPAKSGVGGGIIASVRDRMGIGVYGPSLDTRGNSIAGLVALKALSDSLDLRVL